MNNCVCFNSAVKIFASNKTDGMISDAIDKGQFGTFTSLFEIHYRQNRSRLR